MKSVRMILMAALAALSSGVVTAGNPKLTPKEVSLVRTDFEKLLKDEKDPAVRRQAAERVLATDDLWIGVYQRAADELAKGEMAAERWEAVEALYSNVLARADNPASKTNVQDWYERNLVSLKVRRGDVAGAMKLMEKRGDRIGIAGLYRNTLDDPARADEIYRQILDDPKSPHHLFSSAYVAVAEGDLAVREKYFDRFCGTSMNSTNSALNRIAKEWISMRQNDTYYGRWDAVLLSWRLARRIYDTQRKPVEFKIAQYAAYAACGKRDFAKAAEICDYALASTTNFTPVEAYQLRMMSALLPKPADLAAVAAADAKFGANVPPKARLGAIQRTGSAAMLGNREDLVRVLDAYVKEHFKDEEKLVYTVRYSAEPVFEAADFDRVPAEKSPMARKFGGDVTALFTDVATGRGAVSTAAAGKVPPTIRIVADDWGLHFRYDVPCTNAAAMRTGALASGSFEGYLSTGLGKPYASLIYDIAKADLWYWTTLYETKNRRNAKRHDPDNTRASTAYRQDGVTVYYALSWDIFAAELPEDGTEWEYENIYWGPKSSAAWNGMKGVHHRSTWGRLRFAFAPAELAAIRRRQLVKGMRDFWKENFPSNDGTMMFDTYKDNVFGDPEFYDRELVPLVDRIKKYGKRIKPTMSDEETMTLSREILPTLANLKYVVAERRARYLRRKLTDGIPPKEQTPPVIDDRLPAGNIRVLGIDGDTVRVDPDLRDTEGPWFYWAFRVKGAKGRTLTFKFDEKLNWGGSVGVRGPAVTTDGGKTWSYPCDGPATQDKFTYTFADDKEVRFYETWQYLPPDWEAFLAAHADDRGKKFETDVLCRSRKGREVPKARFGCLDGKPKYRLFFSSRHHCSEATATPVLEGLASAFLKDDDLGRWLCANVELLVVPFADYDGVVDGDQGKNRKPHDHNRDYTEFVYPETRAIRDWVGSHAGGRLDVFVDVHCPWLRRGDSETLYTPWKDPAIVPDATAEKRYSQLLEKLQCGSLRYRAKDDLPFGKAWNTGKNYGQGRSAVIWACQEVKGLRIARSYEVPFANANGAVVTPDACRQLGADTAKVIRALLTEQGKKK